MAAKGHRRTKTTWRTKPSGPGTAGGSWRSPKKKETALRQEKAWQRESGRVEIRFDPSIKRDKRG